MSNFHSGADGLHNDDRRTLKFSTMPLPPAEKSLLDSTELESGDTGLLLWTTADIIGAAPLTVRIDKWLWHQTYGTIFITKLGTRYLDFMLLLLFVAAADFPIFTKPHGAGTRHSVGKLDFLR